MAQDPQILGVHWQVSPTPMHLDHQPRILLLVEALRDTTACFLRVGALGLDGQRGPALVLGHCPPAYGVRRFKVQSGTPGRQFVRACGNFPSQRRWECVKPILTWDIPAGKDYVMWSGHLNELRLMPGMAIALVGSCAEPCRVKVEMAGV